MEKAYKDEEFISEVLSREWKVLKANGWNQKKLGQAMGHRSQAYISRFLKGYQGKGLRRTSFSRGLGQLFNFCNATELSPNLFGIATEESTRSKAKYLYLMAASANGDEAEAQLATKYGITGKEPEQRLIQLNAEKIFYKHRLLLSIEFSNYGVAFAVETAIVERFGRVQLGEYVYDEKHEVWPYLEPLLKYYQHEVKYY